MFAIGSVANFIAITAAVGALELVCHCSTLLQSLAVSDRESPTAHPFAILIKKRQDRIL